MKKTFAIFATCLFTTFLCNQAMEQQETMTIEELENTFSIEELCALEGLKNLSTSLLIPEKIQRIKRSRAYNQEKFIIICHLCDKQCIKMDHLEEHMATTHNSGYYCLCSKYFAKKRHEYREHRRKCVTYLQQTKTRKRKRRKLIYRSDLTPCE